jgi:hypothetical protein
VLEKGQQRIAIEIKSSTAPKVSRGFWNAIEDINSTANYVIAFRHKLEARWKLLLAKTHLLDFGMC